MARRKAMRLTGLDLEFVSLVKRGDDPEAKVIIAKAETPSAQRKASKSVSDLLGSRTLSNSTENKE